MADLFPGVSVVAGSSLPERARAHSWLLGAGRAVVVQDAESAVERRVQRPDATSEVCKLLLQAEGESQLVHAGRRARLAAGDLALMDGSRPFRMELAPGYRQIVIELPRRWLSLRCPGWLGLAGEQLSGLEPAHQLLFRSAHDIVQQLPALGARQRAPLLDAVLALLVALEPSGSSTESTNRFVRACADLDAHLSDPDLNAESLARLQNISRRHLDAVFARRGHSPERLIWERRLERIHQDLQDPALAGRRLIDIAFAWGFNSQAH
ncbi:MAG TPA: helix-turn-helix domain-containing protein, partial [Polyangiaceae bacterium]|nr:helix-turn-helix domain-containing protein [Polyangiaceae bacterium]